MNNQSFSINHTFYAILLNKWY